MIEELQKAVRKLEDDMRGRSEEVPQIAADLRARYAEAKQAGRTAAAYEEPIRITRNSVKPDYEKSCEEARAGKADAETNAE